MELIVNSEDKGEIHVNKQMALTQYVQETRKSLLGAQGQLQNHSIQEIDQTLGSRQQATVIQPQQPAKQLPPRPSVNTQNAQLSQATVQHVQPVKQSLDQELLPSKQAWPSQQLTTSLKNPVLETLQNVRVNQQSLPNQNMEPVEKSLLDTLQKQQLPSYVYQLFEKKEVIEVLISHVSHRFNCLVFHSLSTHSPLFLLLLTRDPCWFFLQVVSRASTPDDILACSHTMRCTLGWIQYGRTMF